MSETKTLGKVCDSATGGAVYEDIGSSGETRVYGPLHWADFGLTGKGETEADRAMQRGIALHNLDKGMVKPLLSEGAHRVGLSANQRLARKRKRQFARAVKVYGRGGRLPRNFGWWGLICFGLMLVFASALSLGILLIWQSMQAGASIC